MSHRKTARIGAFLEGLRGRGTALVVTHDHPDPDCMATAWLMKHLFAEHSGLETTIAHGGVIGRAENRAMVTRLRIPLVPLSSVDPAGFGVVCLVDTQPGTGNNSLPAGARVDMVIDHHPRKSDLPRLPWVDIRPGYGATVSIVHDYARTLGFRPDRRLATAIFYALKCETQDLGRESSVHDRRVYLQMAPLFDPAMLFDILYAKVTRAYFQTLNHALNNARLYEDVLVTNLMDIDNPDHVAEVADMLLRLEGVKWTLVMGRYAGNVHLSIRTMRRDVNAGEIMRVLVGGMGTGGGHDMIAGGKIANVSGDERMLRTLEDALTKLFLGAVQAPIQVGEELVAPSTEGG